VRDQEAIKNNSKLGHCGYQKLEGPQTKGVTAQPKATGTLFGLSIAEPLQHQSGHYPYPALLNETFVKRFHYSKRGRNYRKGATLFEEGAEPGGAYVVLEGRVKLSVNSPQGKAMVLGFFGPGAILGLAAAVLGRSHISTAETIQPTRAVFVPRNELLAEIRSHPIAAWQVAQLVSEHCYFLLTKMATVELSESAQQKMARCLLGLIHQKSAHEGAHVELNLSQETIAQMVGLSRETVSRLLSRLRRKGVLDWTRSDFIIRNRQALEKLADLPESVGGHNPGAASACT
jgi:CRP/FNR family cyclic AMP-dependent transcriptional regulator